MEENCSNKTDQLESLHSSQVDRETSSNQGQKSATIISFPVSCEMILLHKCKCEIEKTDLSKSVKRKEKKGQHWIVIFTQPSLKEYLCHVAQMMALSLKKTGDFTELHLIN